MNKAEFEKYIAETHSITQKEAGNMIDTVTSSLMSALAEGNEVSLIGL
jgi:nucleoid DNA-binding protein